MLETLYMYLLKTFLVTLWYGYIWFSHPIWASFIGRVTEYWLTCTLLRVGYSYLRDIVRGEMMLLLGSAFIENFALHATHYVLSSAHVVTHNIALGLIWHWGFPCGTIPHMYK